jgi:hypothetical protein
MICPDCQGARMVRHVLQHPVPIGEEPQGPGLPPVVVEITAIKLPCQGCGGTGIASCCEGALGLAADVPGQ